ncbi:hypothetical protein SUGI_0461190 [Cryptomeria japonica]|uniref:putative disease resistance protein At1g63350 n=1 Tax=Cryptomeria japonica TaxID=3369 RepID=UPI00240898AF|nr:putative disease resistance protein At1g63350 [Cryptomeria japonica]GLJ24175.1 hypothetical protein SUGI_0461190 [Cryptomeria japonica]
MEIATAILPLVLEPAISILLKRISNASNSIDAYHDDLRSLSSRVSILKSLVTQLLDRLNSSTGRISETLLEPAKLWLERWNDVIEDAETTIAECNDDDQGSTCCMPRRNNMRRIKQAMKNIKEMHNEAPTFIMTFFLHMLTQSQIGFQDARNGAPQLITQMAVTHPMPNVLRRLQDTASTVTISTGFNGQLLCGEIDTHSPDFALTMGSCNPPISVIVNCSEDEGNPLALTNNVGNAQEMTIQCCEEQILITTNVDRVLEIEALSEQERWEVFQFHVFKNSHHQGDLLLHRNDMEDISRAIFRTIAAKSYLIEGVAHILAKFNNPFYWQLKSALFSSAPEPLYDRYEALPMFIKLCFLSCAAFPQAEEIDVENLLELWIAEGLLSIKHDLIGLVSFGYQVMKLLLRYSLIEVSVYDWAGRPVRCILPSRIHEMAVQILDQNERCFFRPRQNLELFSWPESPLCRSISLIGNNIISLPTRSGSASVRSLLLAGNTRLAKIPSCFLQGLISLRVLDLSDTGVVSLPSSLGDLKNLIHLNLSRTKIISLPKICIKYLKKLRSLLLSCCIELKSLPPEICKIQSLKLLDVSGCTSLTSFPYTIMELKELQVLKINSTQVWNSKSGLLEGMAELCLTGQRRYAILSDLKTLINLKRLHLDSEEDSLISDGVMGNMHKMQSLWLRMTKLEHLPEDMTAMAELCELQLLKCMKLQELPSWVCEFLELRFLCLNSCYSLRSLPCLETLPLLRVLEIVDCEALMELPSEFGREGAFPALQSFTLRGLKIRSLQIHKGAMPMLRRMALENCNNLECLPEELEYLENLQTLDITASDLLIQTIASPSNLWALNSGVQVIPPIYRALRNQ